MSLTNSTPDTSKVERHGYLFGYPIAHSMSPLLHQTVYDELGLDWSQLPLESTDMNLFLDLIKHPSFYGTHSTHFYDRELTIYRSISYNATQSRHTQIFG
jgi:quinate dehydrogenase